MDRPDWAADDTAADDAPADDAPADGARAHESEGPNGEPAVSDESGTATDGDGPGVGASATDEGSNPNRNPLPSWVNEGGEEAVDDDTPRAPLRARGAHAATETETETERESGGTPFVPPVPGSATLPSSAPSAPSAQDTAAIGVPFAAPLPPLPGATGPALPLPTADGGPTSADSDLDDDVDETRIVSKTPTRAPFVLHFSTGERFGVHGTGLVGRLPRPQPGERFDDLVTVHDPGKSVSKTHLELGRDGDDLWVSDRFSGNGTVVRHIDGSIRRCEPGRRYRVERGARVDIGEQFFLVQ
nr:FHA domain-containing protein [Curtobacterium pusillum]